MRVKPKNIILTYKERGNIVDTAQRLGIHPVAVYRWIKKASVRPGILSSRNLRRKSTKPKTIYRYEFTTDQKLEIETLRKQKGWMAKKIVRLLNLSCHSRTLHRYLIRRHLVREYKYSRRPLFQNTGHMNAKNTKTIGYLQMDVKYITPELSGLAWTSVLNTQLWTSLVDTKKQSNIKSPGSRRKHSSSPCDNSQAAF